MAFPIEDTPVLAGKYAQEVIKEVHCRDKFILDACCGGRMMWFNKNHPNAIYIDNRIAESGHITNRPEHSVKPDLLMDFRRMTFPDKTFKLVVWDPPHLVSLQQTSWMAKKYGVLDKETWQADLKQGFDECWRVLDDFGVLIFKWSEQGDGKKRSKPVRQLIDIFGKEPLIGHTVGSKSNTHWMTFMKIPEQNG